MSDHRGRRPEGRGQRGAVTVEFALVVPVVLTLLSGITVLGLRSFYAGLADYSARAAVRELVLPPRATGAGADAVEVGRVEDAVADAFPGFLGRPTAVTICPPTCTPACPPPVAAGAVVVPLLPRAGAGSVGGVGRSDATRARPLALTVELPPVTPPEPVPDTLVPTTVPVPVPPPPVPLPVPIPDTITVPDPVPDTETAPVPRPTPSTPRDCSRIEGEEVTVTVTFRLEAVRVALGLLPGVDARGLATVTRTASGRRE